MIKLLQTAYPSHYGAKWKDVYSVRFEHTYLASFAIKDNKPTIIQDEENSAVSLYVNPEGKILLLLIGKHMSTNIRMHFVLAKVRNVILLSTMIEEINSYWTS